MIYNQSLKSVSGDLMGHTLKMTDVIQNLHIRKTLKRGKEKERGSYRRRHIVNIDKQSCVGDNLSLTLTNFHPSLHRLCFTTSVVWQRQHDAGHLASCLQTPEVNVKSEQNSLKFSSKVWHFFLLREIGMYVETIFTTHVNIFYIISCTEFIIYFDTWWQHKP